MSNSLDSKYQQLLQDILDFGVEKSDRTGTGTKSIFGYTISHKMSHGFPILTTKKVHFKSVATELIWFLRGDTNIKYLVDNNCHIWDGDAYKNYLIEDVKVLPNMSKEKMTEMGFRLTQEEFINKIKTDDEFAKKWGELGPIYGKQWRSWEGRIQIEPCKLDSTWEYLKNDSYLDNQTGIRQEPIDQIANLISELKTNPDSRRLMVNAWNVGELDEMVLPPCHHSWQMYTRELSEDERYDLCAAQKSKMIAISEEDYIKHNIPTRAISLSWNQRSVDSALGLPFNIASYGLLLEMIAREVNMIPEHLIGQLGDCHLYLDHLEGAKEQISREPRELPRLHMSSGHNFRAALAGKVDEIDLNDFMLIGYDPHPTIKFPLSN
jgi:thymidylate synthase